MEKFTFLIPVYNDWNSLNILLNQIDKEILSFDDEFNVIILNDCSTENHSINKDKFQKIGSLKIINLRKNLGSQRALAIGLKHIANDNEKTKIILMDADGEDDPSMLKEIINFSKKEPKKIITVNRTKRNEHPIFRLMYEMHYFFTILLTGKKIRFGNYSLLNSENLKKLFLNGDLWGAYPATVVKNFIEIKSLFCERKKRYSDKTKMNLFALFFHSLRIISVFKKRVILTSSIYIFLLVMVNLFYNSTFFVLLIILLVLLNILIFITNLKNNKKHLENYLAYIESIDSI